MAKALIQTTSIWMSKIITTTNTMKIMIDLQYKTIL